MFRKNDTGGFRKKGSYSGARSQERGPQKRSGGSKYSTEGKSGYSRDAKTSGYSRDAKNSRPNRFGGQKPAYATSTKTNDNRGGRPSSGNRSYGSDNRRSADQGKCQGGFASKRFGGGGGRSFGSQNRSGGGWGGNRGGGRGGRMRTPHYDHNQFIKKAELKKKEEVFVTQNTFDDFAINEKLKKTIKLRKYTSPTPIQDGAINHILKGSDLIGLANTGTGKTGAFLIPLIDKVCRDRKQRVLILVPTRELALQINEEFTAFSVGLGIRSTICIGGLDMRRQMRFLRGHNQFVIGTPGRVTDLVKRKMLNLADVNNVVLDEVDRMLDMGFIKEITYLLSLTQKNKQSLFFSATMEKKARELALQFLNNPITVQIKARPTSENVEQDVVFVKRGEKMEVLHDLLTKKEYEKVLIFGKTKHGAKRLGKDLGDRGFKAGAIHGDLTQGQRQRVLKNFKENHLTIMVATDVVARGLDIENVTHVINYELPATYDDYIHRIGRTGRGSKTGKALTFIEK
ncbi:MAG: DEAD/DEAH box helicase [Candidatus Moranbacteria bacterium]|nr:DEAD/DEAH box helicase [Candidatus Moranbacteria bacterium]